MLSFLFACYVDKKKLKEAGINYLKGNEVLAMDELALMDHVKILASVIRLKSLDQTTSLQPSELEFEEQYNEMAKSLCNIPNDKDYYTDVTIELNQMFNVVKPLSNTETRSQSKLLKSNFPLKQIPGCIVITVQYLMKLWWLQVTNQYNSKDKAGKLAAMTARC